MYPEYEGEPAGLNHTRHKIRAQVSMYLKKEPSGGGNGAIGVGTGIGDILPMVAMILFTFVVSCHLINC